MRILDVFRHRTVANAGWIIAGRMANKLLAFLVGILTARYLGPDNYGVINYAAAYTTLFASVCSLGINSVLVKELVEHPDQEGETIGTTIVLQTLSGILSAGMIVGIVSIIDRWEPMTVWVVALYSLGAVFQAAGTLSYWFQAKLMSKYPAIASLIAYTLTSAYKIFLLASGKHILWFAVANSVEYLVVAGVLYAAYRKQGGPTPRVSLRKAGELLHSSHSFILTGLMVSIYASTDKFMLKQMLDEASVGYYSLAASFSTAWVFVLQAIVDSMYPGIVRERSLDRRRYERRNRQLYAIVFYVSILMSLAVALAAGPLIRTLYGAAYLPAVKPLRVIVWYTAFSYLGVARNAWIVCEGQQRYLKYIYLSSALANVGLNALLIPRFGASGAAAASLVTQMVTIILPVWIRPLRPNARLMWEAVLLRDTLPNRKRTEEDA